MGEPQSPERWEQIKRLFFAACECEGAARDELLARETGEDPELRARVERLLNSARAATFLERGGALLSFAVEDHPENDSREQPLPTLGGYRALRVIGVGGTSTVYEAEQDNPHRTVALKVLRMNLASPSMQQRFEWESRILARLRHPAIGQVYAASVHEDVSDRVPYFAMEYVEGAQPITQFAAHRALPTRARLDLFAQVCDAVHHAHQQGIIHRDLKPGNILVDAGGQPKVIDFGVARVVINETAFSTLHTQPGQIIGTLAYMSPEQCEMDPDAIDTRTDIYSLGVLLYELLCDRHPHQIEGIPLLAAVRTIREAPPARPSTVDRSLRGDLDTIVVKAMAADRERRYASVSALRDDVLHYLRNEPIEARPVSGIYQLRKLISRHRRVALLCAISAALLFTSTVVMKLQRDAALRATSVARAAEERSAADRAEAAAEAERAQHVQRFLTELFRFANPYAASDLGDAGKRAADVTARELLDRGTERALADTQHQPLVQAALMEAIGEAYQGLGLDERAVPLFEQALANRRSIPGASQHDIALCSLKLASALGGTGQRDQGEAACREAIRILEAEPSPDGPTLGLALYRLAHVYYGRLEFAESRRLILSALDRRRGLGLQDSYRHEMLSLLGTIQLEEGDPASAERTCWQAIESYRQTTSSMGAKLSTLLETLGSAAERAGHVKRAETIYRQVVALMARTLGTAHPDTADAALPLAQLLRKQGRFASAEALYREVAAALTRDLGARHWKVGRALLFLGICRAAQYHEAVPTLRDAVTILRESLGNENPLTAMAIGALARALTNAGRLDEAEQDAREALRLMKQAYGEHHLNVVKGLEDLSFIAGRRGDDAEARTRLEHAIEILEQLNDVPLDYHGTLLLHLALIESNGDREIAEAHLRASLDELAPTNLVLRGRASFALATLLERRGDDEDAAGRFRDALAAWREGEEYVEDLPQCLARGGRALARAGHAVEAAPLLARALELAAERHEARSERARADALAGQGMIEMQRGRANDAEPLLEESLASEGRLKSSQGLENAPWLRAEVEGLLGLCRSELEDFPGADELLSSSAKKMEAELGRSHPRSRRAMTVLADFYDSWNETARATEVRRTLEANGER